MNRRNRPPMHRQMQGMTLIELMIAITLGLLVMGAAIGIFISNRQVYRAAENLNRMQEGGRVAFELMARDIREAGGNPCVNNLPLANVLTGYTGAWWSNLDQWGNGLRGFGPAEAFPDAAFGTATAERLTGTDALQLLSGDDNVVTIEAHDTAGAEFRVNTATHAFGVDDVAMACNARQASIFQVASVVGQDIGHGTGGSSPGNCTAGLGLPADCSGEIFEFSAPNSMLVRLNASRWFIANNANGRSSLYQSKFGGGNVNTQEVVEGVRDMTLTYLLAGGNQYVDAATVGNNWANVTAVRVVLDLDSEDRIGTDGNPLTRQFIQVASLRNRNP